MKRLFSTIENPFSEPKPRNSDDAQLVGKILGPEAEAAMRKSISIKTPKDESSAESDFIVSDDERAKFARERIARGFKHRFSSLVENCNRSARVMDDADALLHVTETKAQDFAYVFTAIGRAQARIGENPSAAFAIAKRTVDFIDPGTPIDPAYDSRTEILVVLAETQAETGRFFDAANTADDIQAEKSRIEAFLKIAKAEFQQGRDPEETLNAAKQRARLFNLNDASRDSVFFDIATTEAEIGCIDDAKETMRAIPEESSAQDAILPLIADAEAKAGNFEVAEMTVEGIKNKADRGWAYCSIAEIAAKAGHNSSRMLALSEELCEEAGEDESTTFNFFNVAVTEAVVGYFDRAKKTAEKINNLESYVSALSAIAAYEARAGRDATSTFATLKKMAEESGDEADFLSIAGNEIEAGYLRTAKKTLTRIVRKDNPEYGNVLNRLAIAEAKAGSFDVAKKIVQDDSFHDNSRLGVLLSIATMEAAAGCNPTATLDIAEELAGDDFRARAKMIDVLATIIKEYRQ